MSLLKKYCINLKKEHNALLRLNACNGHISQVHLLNKAQGGQCQKNVQKRECFLFLIGRKKAKDAYAFLDFFSSHHEQQSPAYFEAKR